MGKLRSYAAQVFVGALAMVGAPQGARAAESALPPDAVEWHAQAKAGAVLTSGNSRTSTLSLAANASRKQAANKLSLDAGAAYGRADLLVARDLDGDGTVGGGELDRDRVDTTEIWFAKARYDRFVTEHNSAFVAGLISADRLAGKELVGGAQAGFSRQIYKSATHEVVAEAGYDFSYEDYVVAGDAVSIHSARLYVGEVAKLSDTTGVTASLEALTNLNDETTPTGEVGALEDMRLLGKVGVSAALRQNVSLMLSFTARYDAAPAPLPRFALPFAAGFQPEAEELDTITEAAVIVTFF